MDGNTQPTERDQPPVAAPTEVTVALDRSDGTQGTPAPAAPGAIAVPAPPVPPSSPAPIVSGAPIAPLAPTAPTAASPVLPAAPAQSLVAAPVPPAPATATVAEPIATPEPDFYRAEDDQDISPAEPPTADDGSTITWTASEFVAHHKSAGWYAFLLAFGVAAAAVIWLITKDIFAASVILLAIGILAGFAARKPREAQYAVDGRGITIDQKHLPFQMFRSFSVFEDGAFSSIELMPLRRFSPPVSMYYDPKDEAAIADALASHLPFEPRERDALDKLMHKIRF